MYFNPQFAPLFRSQTYDPNIQLVFCDPSQAANAPIASNFEHAIDPISMVPQITADEKANTALEKRR